MLFYRKVQHTNPNPYVFLHGFMGNSLDWEEIQQDFYGSIAIDLPGHGRSFFPKNTPLDLFNYFSKLIEATLDKLEIKKIHLVGYSLGGRVAMHFSHLFPDKLLSLSLISAHPGLKEGKDKRLIQDEKWIYDLKNLPYKTFLEKWYSQPIFSALYNYQDLIEKRADQNTKYFPTILTNLSVARQTVLLDHIEKKPFPIKLIYGQKDQKYKDLYKQYNLNTYEVKNSAHNPIIDNPSQLKEIFIYD